MINIKFRWKVCKNVFENNLNYEFFTCYIKTSGNLLMIFLHFEIKKQFN